MSACVCVPRCLHLYGGGEGTEGGGKHSFYGLLQFTVTSTAAK